MSALHPDEKELLYLIKHDTDHARIFLPVFGI